MQLAVDETKQLNVTFGGYSSAGTKPSNEDAFAALQPSAGALHFKGAVACIADGVSCSDNAQQASQTSVTQFIEDYYSTPDTWPVKTAAARVLSSMNSWLYHYDQHSIVRHNGLVTTFSAVICKSTTAHLFHVGDSRIYLYRDNQLLQLTRDHSHRQRGDKVFLTRALGMDSRLEVDYIQEDLKVGDVLMLTTDGVHEFVAQQQLIDLLSAADFSSNAVSLEKLAERIVGDALANGSEDNLSCLFVRVDNLPKEEIDEVHRQLTQLTIPPVMDVGMSIDGYEVLSVLHSGTRSHIYLVKAQDGDRRYVLKAPSPNFAEDPHYLEGFIREQWVGRRVDSPRVMKIYNRPDNSPFLYHLCEYVEGQSLRQWIYDHPHPDLERVRDLVKSIVTALRVFQRMDMVHRDLKPENILLDKNGQVKLIDFGTVLVSGLGEINSPLEEEVPVGSVDYIAPEYLLGNRGQLTSDIFSLAAITYEMLTGKLPYKPHFAQRRPKHFSDWHYQPAREQRPDLPQWVDLALQKALEPDPRNRYQAFSEFVQDLCVPNEAMLQKQANAPLIERNPVRFWQLLALMLMLIIIVQWFFMKT